MTPTLRYLVLPCVLGLAACKTGSSGGTDTGETIPGLTARQALLSSVANNVVLPLLAQFEADATALANASAAYATDPAQANREAAQTAWRAAMATWQRLENFQLGPAAPANASPGGQDLRSAIYSWPLTNACRIDQETVKAELFTAAAIANAAVNVRGLDAIEYLLFDADTGNACPANMPINVEGQWEALGDAGVTANRASYAAAAAADVLVTAQALRSAWAADGGNFADSLALAGRGSSAWSTTQGALNALTDAMFYLEKEVKDMKLARPLGLADCSQPTCPEAVESRYAGASFAHVRANLEGFADAFVGHTDSVASGDGFDDLLVAIGAGDLAQTMLAQIDAARAALDAAGDTTLEAALAGDDPAVAGDVYNALRDLSTTLKTDFLSTLDLDLPQRAEGDND